MHNGLTDIPGLLVGHWTDLDAATGCTVILTPSGAVAGVDVRGGAPGTRETSLLSPTCLVDRVHGIMLAGGSAFGLAAADGAMHWLEEHGYGFDVGVAKVPIVPSAILFDLIVGRADVRPDAAAGYAACVDANAGPVVEGSVGAGTGASIGKVLGIAHATKGGIGTVSHHFGNGLIIAALAVVNAWGDVFDSTTGKIVAGARGESDAFMGTLNIATASLDPANPATWSDRASAGQVNVPLTNLPLTNTTLGIVATNAKLTKTQATKMAQMAHDGLARTIRPVHTALDGDTVFALGLGEYDAQENVNMGLIGALAADLLGEAVLRGVQMATSLHDLPAARDLKPG